MIVKLFDKTEIQVTEEQAEKIKDAVKRQMDYIEVGGELFKTSAISSVIEGDLPYVEPQLVTPIKRLDSGEMSEEQRLKNLQHIADLKAKWAEILRKKYEHT